MPSDESLRLGQYYANPSNQFWKLISPDFELHSKPYNIKCKYLLNQGIAIWDVFSEAIRDGSSDANIRNGKPNNFDTFFQKFPNIKYILFNGSTAEKAFKLFFPHYYNKFYCKRLDSSSGAFAKKLAEKQKVWQEALKSCI
jgi:hypoxanthine-DNA glycosylase